jgi:hypothetical protein
MGRELGCFHVVVQSEECILNKSKLGLDFLKLCGEASVVVLFDLRVNSPIIKIVGVNAPLGWEFESYG